LAGANIPRLASLQQVLRANNPARRAVRTCSGRLRVQASPHPGDCLKFEQTAKRGLGHLSGRQADTVLSIVTRQNPSRMRRIANARGPPACIRRMGVATDGTTTPAQRGSRSKATLAASCLAPTWRSFTLPHGRAQSATASWMKTTRKSRGLVAT